MCESSADSNVLDLASVQPGQIVRIATLETHFYTLTATTKVEAEGDEVEGFSIMTNYIAFNEREPGFDPSGIRMQRYVQIDKQWWINETDKFEDFIWSFSVI